MGSQWQEDSRQKLHQAQGLVPVKVAARDCVDGCKHFAPEINWCRLKLCSAPEGCSEHTVKVSYRRRSYRPEHAGHSARKPRGD